MLALRRRCVRRRLDGRHESLSQAGTSAGRFCVCCEYQLCGSKDGRPDRQGGGLESNSDIDWTTCALSRGREATGSSCSISAW